MRTEDISKLMKDNISEYSRYVAQERAIPALGDGMKPSQRRSLLTGYDLRLFHDRRFMKAAKIEGDVVGNYHPHGGVSLAGLIQPFTIRYPIFEGQGNWGSPDMPGSYAASRYTEAKLTEFAEKFYLESVDYADKEDNYDGRLQEVTQFYPPLPGCMITGAMGIAIGLSTKLPTHNIKDLGKSLKDYILGKDSYKDLIPDTCEESIILTPKSEIRKMYEVGTGSIGYKAKTHYETIDNRYALVVDAFPPGYNKSRLNTASILDAVDSGRLELINESKDTIRYVFLSTDLDVLEEIEDRLTNSVGYSFYIEHKGVVKKYSLKEIYDTFISDRSAYIVRKYTDLHDKLSKEVEYYDILIRFKEDRSYIKGMFDKSSKEVVHDIVTKYETTEEIANRIISTSIRSLLSDNVSQILAKINDYKSKMEAYARYVQDPTSKILEDIDDIIKFMRGDKRKAIHVDEIKDSFKMKHRGKTITIKASELYYIGNKDNTVKVVKGSEIVNLDDSQSICQCGYDYYILSDGYGICGMTREAFEAGNKFKSGELSDIIGTNVLKTVSYKVDGRVKYLDDWCLRKRSSYIRLSDKKVSFGS